MPRTGTATVVQHETIESAVHVYIHSGRRGRLIGRRRSAIMMKTMTTVLVFVLTFFDIVNDALTS